MLPKLIRTRIALLLALLMLAVLLLAGGTLYFSLRTQLLQTLDDSLRFNAEQLLASVENENGRLVFGQGDLRQQNRSAGDMLVQLVMADGTVTDSPGSTSLVVPGASQQTQVMWVTVREPGEQAIAPASVWWFGDSSFNGQMRIVSVPVLDGGNSIAWVQVGRGMEAIHETLTQLLFLLCWLIPAVLVVTSLSGYWLAGRVLQPIELIRRQAAAMSAQDLANRLDLDLPDDEVGRLARTFDQMLARLQASFVAQQRFVSDASHELRTPLAIIRGECEVTLTKPRTATAYVEALHSIVDESSRMERLVANLLWLARNDHAAPILQHKDVDLTELLTNLLDSLAASAAAAQVTIQTDLPAPLPCRGDRDPLIQVFRNLLENAFTYAPGSVVTVRGQLDTTEVTIAVADTGPGIAPEHLPHLFDRFYRVDDSRNRAHGGSGLGLAIAQEIVQAHGGAVTVVSALKAGTTFTVRLPLST
ncbi:MAG: HAMP domain-containing protein [Caldilineaceae bacterium]|nr:HAMP domain-containing protein [Caldilineaceae bacterium]